MGIQCFSVYFIKHTHFKPKGNRNTKTLVTTIWGTFKTKRDLFEAEYMIIPALFIQRLLLRFQCHCNLHLLKQSYQAHL